MPLDVNMLAKEDGQGMCYPMLDIKSWLLFFSNLQVIKHSIYKFEVILKIFMRQRIACYAPSINHINLIIGTPPTQQYFGQLLHCIHCTVPAYALMHMHKIAYLKILIIILYLCLYHTIELWYDQKFTMLWWVVYWNLLLLVIINVTYSRYRYITTVCIVLCATDRPETH